MHIATIKLSKDRKLNLAVIGGGAATREFIIRFVDSHAREFPLSITVFEPRQALGRGIAWSDESTKVLANMRVETLGPSYLDYDLIQTLLIDIGHEEAGAEYPSRNAMGAALDERWRRTAAQLPETWEIDHKVVEVTDIEWQGTSAAVYTIDDKCHNGFDLVLLSLGNVPAKPPVEFKDNPRFINGWDVAAIERIAPNCDVFIKGAGLTAIDATMRLLHCGHPVGSRSIVWHSRSGLLPFVRPKQLKIDPDFLSYHEIVALRDQCDAQKRDLTLAMLFRLFELEMKSQSRKLAGKYAIGTDLNGFAAMLAMFRDPAMGREQIDFGIRGSSFASLWFSVAKLFDEYVIPFAWNALPDAEKAAFMERWRREFDRFWAPIPVDNGIRLREWLSNNTIQLVRSKVQYRADPANGKLLFDASLDDPLGEIPKDSLSERYASGFDYIIDAGGIPADLNKLNSTLVQNLLARGILMPFRLRQTNGVRFTSLGAKTDWYTGAVLASDDRPHGWLYTLTGSLTAGAHRFTNSYLAASISAQRVVAELSRQLID